MTEFSIPDLGTCVFCKGKFIHPPICCAAADEEYRNYFSKDFPSHGVYVDEDGHDINISGYQEYGGEG